MENENTHFKVFAGGPLEVKGRFRIQGPDGKIIESEDAVLLCRCGNSSNKPFCDESHKRNGFSE
ncbi:MAG: CDGSH iron-sulfur domain-containing protein [Bacteroidota bacterium]|nr:CDGSH iron-sulfur domain-containing protein [Bacteroidota bacterium]